MGQLICFFSVAVLITLLHIFKIFLMEEKYDFFEILGYYLKATLIINIILIIAVLIINRFWIWNKELSNDFVIRYVIAGSIAGLFLPKIYYDVRKIRRKEK
jgi:hypothetical protein